MYIRTGIFALCVPLAFALAQQHLSFEEAYQRRLEIDKNLSAMDQHRSAAKLNIELSTTLNPTELEAVIGDFGRDEIEVAATKVIEFPSIRKSRRLVAETELNGLAVEVDNLQIQIHHDLSTYFLSAGILERQLKLAQERLVMSRRILEWQEHQFTDGALPESELIRTRYEIAGLNVEFGKLELSRELIVEEVGLYLDTALSETRLGIEIPEFPDDQVINDAWSQLGTAPDLTRRRAQVNRLRAVREASETPWISSVALSAGLKLVPEIDEQFPIIGLSLETPSLSKRSKKIQQSEFELRASMDELAASKADITMVGRQWKNRWNMNLHELNSLQEILIPEAQQLYKRIEEEYRAGVRQYLEVLNTQTLLTDLRQKELDIQFEMATLLFEMNLTLGVTIYEFD